ncbi:hypothetical protein [Methylocella sp.]|jgi:hypothetical protein|uniref:hypothetical protein n=1 Tax=Methylocella sp. TaxID=1978226 RepID=UPI003C1EA224
MPAFILAIGETLMPSPDILPAERREIARITKFDPRALAKLTDEQIAVVLRAAAAGDAKLRARLYGWRPVPRLV